MENVMANILVYYMNSYTNYYEDISDFYFKIFC